MIIYHQNNIAGFAGGHVVYWFGQPFFSYRISKTSAAATGMLFRHPGMTGRMQELLGGMRG